MQVSDELLSKFFKGQCTQEEKLLVAAYLNEAEELPDTLLSKNDWDDTEEANLTAAQSDKMFKAVTKKTQARVQRLKWIKISAAAAVMIAALTAALFHSNTDQPGVQLAKNTVQNLNQTAEIHWKSVVNYTEQTQELTLPDQSTVKIYPGGELRYSLPFVQDNREVHMKGKSFFNVSKDEKHPFTVYANGIATTALGTSFTITATEKSKLIKVQLHTGKVLVKNADSVRQIATFSQILMPGAELVYDTKVNHVKVTDAKTLLAAEKERKITELNFTQAPLTDVFARLQQHYKVKIIYVPADLEEMSFTGSLELKQPIATILEEIAQLNKLNQTKTSKGYLISR